MSISKGYQALGSDINSWYSALNTIITNYGGGIATIPNLSPTQKQIDAADPNKYYNKLTELQADTYLSHANYPVYSLRGAGNLIYPSDIVSATGAGYLGDVRCRNDAANNSGYMSNGVRQNGKNSSGGNGANGTNSNGNKSVGTPDWAWHNQNNSNGTNSNGFVGVALSYDQGTNSNGSKSNTINSNGTCSSGGDSANGKYANGTIIDIFCANATNNN